MVEFRFEGGQPWSDALRDGLRELLIADYPGEPRTTHHFELQASFSGDAVQTAGRTNVQATLFPSADSRLLVGVGDRLLSVHALAPYCGWTALVAKVRHAVRTFVSVVQPAGVQALAVRYIDRVALPGDNPSLADYFSGLPARPASMPAALAAFHVVTQAVDPDGTLALLTLGSAPRGTAGESAVLFDLTLVRAFVEPLALDAWEGPIDHLHRRQRAIFEESITDQTRSLFS